MSRCEYCHSISYREYVVSRADNCAPVVTLAQRACGDNAGKRAEWKTILVWVENMQPATFFNLNCIRSTILTSFDANLLPKQQTASTIQITSFE